MCKLARHQFFWIFDLTFCTQSPHQRRDHFHTNFLSNKLIQYFLILISTVIIIVDSPETRPTMSAWHLANNWIYMSLRQDPSFKGGKRLFFLLFSPGLIVVCLNIIWNENKTLFTCIHLYFLNLIYGSSFWFIFPYSDLHFHILVVAMFYT